MRIVKVEINSDAKRGLGSVKLHRLGPIVALVGKNGSGKTRILDILYEKICSQDKTLSFENKTSYFQKNPKAYVKKLDAAELDKGPLKIKEFVSFYNSARDPQRAISPTAEKLELITDFLKNSVGKELSKIKTSQQDKIAYEQRIMDFSYLSPGERDLLYYAWLFFASESDDAVEVGEKIYLIDEPELHLHPDAQIRFVKGMREFIGKRGQLWIATHSITILSQLSIDEIVLVKEHAAIGPSRKTTMESIKQLMGIETNLADLQRFIGDISEWAFANFFVQCLHPPQAVSSTSKNDPQINSIFKVIQKKGNLDFLDMGAGKGRVYDLLKEDSNLMKKVNYYALEPNKEYGKWLRGKGVDRLFTQTKELPDNSFDLILLCNVLHEIPPDKWITVFDNIKRSLRQEGYLMIVEDILFPKGENPNPVGFLVLDFASLKLLFGTNNIQSIEHPDTEFQKRILAVIVNNKDIQSIQKENVIAALRSLQKTTFENIKKIKHEVAMSGHPFNEKTIVLGRKQAYYSQLYINCLIAIDLLRQTEEDK